LSFWRPLGLALGVLLVGGAVLALLAVWIGPPILALFAGGTSAVSGPIIGGLVASSALIAAITVSGSAVLSQSRHLIYTLGWVIAAVVTIAIMATPIELNERVVLALTISPAVGLALHLVWLAFYRRAASAVVPAGGTPE
jgi:O-antigen/teichoic acid export membrane protein